MQVILLHDVEKLGKTGDLKDVSNGYARNYLLPQRLAMTATPVLIANREQHIAAEMRKRAKQEEEYRQLAEQLAKVELTVKAHTGKEGRLYGSITTQDIAELLKTQTDITIDRRKMVLQSPVHKIGTYEIPVKIAPGIEASIKLTVVEDNT